MMLLEEDAESSWKVSSVVAKCRMLSGKLGDCTCKCRRGEQVEYGIRGQQHVKQYRTRYLKSQTTDIASAMRVNEHTGIAFPSSTLASAETNMAPQAISTSKVLLVPYSSHHVPTYHAWMQDADLQAATASEPLTMDEEYDMQRSWRTDNDKLTFIVCQSRESIKGSQLVKGGDDDRPDRMIGDINLFLFEPEDDDDEELQVTETSSALVGEIELMIALKDLQRQGYGRAAWLAFTSYILDSWTKIAAEYSGTAGGTQRSLAYLRVKINQSNARSIALFKSIGFVQTAAGANYFGEVELRLQPSKSELQTCKGWEEPQQFEYAE
jgi:RimJ/RimL family protein N-acetyltransferase